MEFRFLPAINNPTRRANHVNFGLPQRVLIAFLGLILLSPGVALGQQAFRSAASGFWIFNTTWEKATSYNPTVWEAAGAGEFPGSNDTVYLEAGFTVTLLTDQSVADIHFNNTADVIRFNTDDNILDVHGKIRIYEGAAPGTSRSGSAGVEGWIDTGTGRIRFVGSESRYVVEKGEFGAKRENRDMTVEFAFDPGDTAYINETVRFGNTTVSSGVLRVLDDHTIRPTETYSSSGVADGNLTINAGAVMYGGRGIFRNKNTAIGTLTVNAGGRLIFTYVDPIIAAQTLNINGSLELLGDDTNQRFPIATTRFGASTISSASKLVLGGQDGKLMLNSFTVQDTLELTDKTTGVSTNGFLFDYDAGGIVLTYSKDSAVTTDSELFPADGSIIGLVINNTGAVTLNEDKFVDGNLTLYNGSVLLGDNNLVLGNTASVNGSPSSTAMVVENGAGQLGRVFNSATNMTWPLGTQYDSANAVERDEYSPFTLNFTQGFFSNDTVFISVRSNFYDQINQPLDTLQRYWNLSLPSGLENNIYTVTYQYTDTDILGTESRLGEYYFEGATATFGGLVDSTSNSMTFADLRGSAVFTAMSECGVLSNTLTTPSTTDYCPDEAIETIVRSEPEVSGTATYTWELSTDGGAFATIGGATGIDLDPAALSSAGTYQYRRGVTSETCLLGDIAYSDTVTITVTNSQACGGGALLLAYYDMDSCNSSVIENKATNTTATLVNGIVEEGYSEQGILLSGSGYLNLGSETGFDLTDAITIAAWVKTSSSGNQTVVTKNRNGGSFSYNLLINSGIPQIALGGLPNPGPFAATTNIADGNWHHIAATFGDGTVIMYVDGVAESTTNSLSGSMNANADQEVWIGARNDKNDRYFDGTVDEVYIYDQPISPTEVSNLAGVAQNSVGCSESGELVGYYALEEDTENPTLTVDSVNLSQSAVLENGPTSTIGVLGDGLSFDGTDDRVLLYDSTWSLGSNDAFSYSLWLKPASDSRGREYVMFRETDGFSLVIELLDALPRVVLGGLDNPGAYAASTSLSIDEWNHLAVTYINGALRIYINGVLSGSYSGLTGSINFGSGFSWVGMRSSFPTSRQYQGDIDEIRIFNFALSASEVSDEVSRVGEIPSDCIEGADPVSVWKFDDCVSGTAVDSLGTNGGTITGATRASGYLNAGMSFDGANDYIDVGSDASLELSTSLTITAWVNTSQNSRATLLFKNRDGSNFAYSVGIDFGVPYLALGGGVSNSGPFSAATTINDGTWHHLAFRFDEGTADVFVDGVLSSTSNGITGSINANSGQTVWIGGRSDKTDRFFGGTLDELRLYNAGLCDTEIAALAGASQSSSDCGGLAPLDAAAADQIGGWSLHNCGSVVATTAVGELNGSFAGGVTRSAGYTGAGVTLDGVDDYINLGSSNQLEVADEFTLGMWMKTNQTGQATVMTKNQVGGHYSYVVALDNGVPFIGLGSEVTDSGPHQAGVAINDGNWHHVGYRLEGGTLDIYIDGVLSYTKNGIKGNIAANTGQEVWIGGRSDRSDRFYQGQLDEVVFYRIGLTDAEMIAMGTTGQSSSDCEAASREVSLITENVAWQVYPNPNTGSFSVSGLDERKGNVQIQMISLLGRSVYQYEGPVENGNHTIALEKASPGMYILQVQQANEQRTIAVKVQ
ncbi:MAG TPA: hypothetical protein DCE41_29860 [Cytophagales bacterium]|nr:hypothetical protein [Cytophagales bacterium]